MKKGFLFTDSERKSVSWSSIFAGTVTVLAALLVLNLIGLSVGLFSVDAHDNSGLGTGTSIWWVVTNIISLFAGGYVAGRVGSSLTKEGGFIHGFLTWALYSLVTVYFVTSAIGSLFSGIGNIVGNIAGGASQIAGNVISNNVDTSNISLSEEDFNNAKSEFESLLRDTEKKELQPENLENKVDNVANSAEAKAEIAAKNPNASDEELDAIFNKMKADGKDILEEADKDALINVIKNRSDMTEEEAREVVNNYEAKYNELVGQAKQKYNEVKANAAQNVDQYTDNVGSAALWLAIALIIGAIAAAFGGAFGAKRNYGA